MADKKRNPAEEEFDPNAYAEKADDSFDPNAYAEGWESVGGGKTAAGIAAKYISRPGAIIRGLVGKATGATPELTGKQIIGGEAPSYGKMYGGGGLMGEIGGGILEVATDPVSMAGPLARGAQKLGILSKESKVPGMLSPLARGQEKVGEALYRSGWSEADAPAKLAFKPKENWPSSYMIKQGKWGGVESRRKAVLDRMKEVMQTREGLFDVADKLGVVIDPKEALQSAYKKVIDKADNLISDQTFDPKLLDEAFDWLNQIKDPMSARQATAQKTNISLPEKFYRTSERGERQPIPFIEGVQKEAQEGLRRGIIQKSERAQENLGNQINLTNEEYEALKSATKPLRMEHRRDIKAPWIPINLTNLSLSKLPLLPTGSASQTGAGLLMRKTAPFAEYILDPLAKKGIIELLQEEESQK
jgi:hypothetical protein